MCARSFAHAAAMMEELHDTDNEHYYSNGLVFILCGTKSTTNCRPGMAVVDIQFPSNDSDNSEYRFVFAVSPKYYLHYNGLS